MVGTLPPRCLQALPHGTKNAATDGPGYRATPRSTTEPHTGLDVRHLPSPSPCGRGEVFSLDIPFYRTYLLHLHAEGEKCFLLTSPFIEPSPSPCGRGEVFSLDIPFYITRPTVIFH